MSAIKHSSAKACRVCLASRCRIPRALSAGRHTNSIAADVSTHGSSVAGFSKTWPPARKVCFFWRSSALGLKGLSHDNGVLVRASGDMIVISPPLIISPEQVEQIMLCLRRARLLDGI